MAIVPKDGKGFLSDFEAIAKADDEYVEIGFFQEQGVHPTARDDTGRAMTYPELAEIQANGGGGRWTPRDIISATARSVSPTDIRRMEKVLSKWLDDPKRNEEFLFDQLGEAMATHMKETFGSQFLNPTAENPDPLIDTGALMSHTAYKVKGKTVKEV